eukprot:1759293-Prymnesium_polylepis.1
MSSAVRPGACIDRVYGCTDSSAANFASDATDQLSCVWAGCTDSLAPNFNPSASHDSGVCAPIYPGCTDNRFENYAPQFNLDDGTCSRGGCMNT